MAHTSSTLAPARRFPASAGPGRGRILVAVTLGSVLAWLGLSAGLGIGLPWLVKAGLDPATVAGLLALAVGAVALIGTLVMVWRGTRGWSRLVLLPVALGLAVGTYALGIALAVTVVPPSPTPSGAPAELPGAREVTMATADGTQLAGWYRPGETSAAVILLHGAGSQRAQGLPHAQLLAQHGFGVLLLDARGHGRSAGRAMDFGWNGETDVAAAVTFLAAQPDVDAERIGVLGLSMGAEEAIGAAGADARIRAVVAEGATGRTAADKAWLSDAYGLAGTVQEQLDRITYGLVDLFTSAPRPSSLVRSAAATDARMLLIAAGGVADEGIVADRLATAAPTRTQVWVVPRAGHVAALSTAPQDWEQRVSDFLVRTLSAPAAAE